MIGCNKFFLSTTLGEDPHTEGINNALNIAKLCGIDGICLPPSDNIEELCKAIKKYSPQYIGLSYRLSSKIGIELLCKTINYFYSSGLITSSDKTKISFAGLPETIKMAESVVQTLPLKVSLVPNLDNPYERALDTLQYFGGGGEHRARILTQLKDELIPKSIEIFNQLADEVIYNDEYKSERPLPLPTEEAKNDFIIRMNQSEIPLLRSHFGIPDKTVFPTVEGIKQLSEARVLDELSLGSSDLSQRYFGQPEIFDVLKNDGGVPYRNEADLNMLYQATRRGNFPSIKPYCHVNGIVDFIHTCLKIGALRGAHQAIPLYWFNELDGRGPHTVEESIFEHFDGVKELVKHGIPVEMNDPNQWSSRYAHDTVVVVSYALLGAVMTMCGVRDMVVQMQFNKPKETGDYADLAKMRAARRVLDGINSYKRTKTPRVHIETRTGIESLSPNMDVAKWQLGRSTLLQMCMNPDVIHIVSYCEANYAARPEDIIDSSKLIRRAIRIFKKYENDIIAATMNDTISDRETYLIDEAKYLLHAISRTDRDILKMQFSEYTPLVGNPEAIIYGIKSGIMSAPGIVNAKYKGNFITKPMKYGMINLVDDFANPHILSDKIRINNLLNDNKI